jgi:mRNA-degrading endonuclease RelE of RelBE toxin-antitoxin system
VTGGWRVILRPLAKRQYRVLEDGPKRDAAELMQDLQEDPLNIPGAVLVTGYKNAERARFHHKRYRMVYEVFKASKTVIVFRMQPRPVVYDGLRKPGGPPKRP